MSPEIDRTNSGLFSFPITSLHKQQKFNPQYHDFIVNLVLNAYSPNKIKALLNSMNLPYSQEQIEATKQDLINDANTFFQRQLPHTLLALYIDGYRYPIKLQQSGRVVQTTVYIAVGNESKVES